MATMHPNMIINQADATEPELASRFDRFFASLLDGILVALVYFPIAMFSRYWDDLMIGSQPSTLKILFAPVLSTVICTLVQVYFLHQSGQTVGKKLMEIKIVDFKTNEQLPVIPLLIKRYIPMVLFSEIPYVGLWFLMIDTLFIFRSDKRCIHDLMADTKVISVSKYLK